MAASGRARARITERKQSKPKRKREFDLNTHKLDPSQPIYDRPWTYRDCTRPACSFTISDEVEPHDFLGEAVKHLKAVHELTDAEIIKSAWYRMLGGE